MISRIHKCIFIEVPKTGSTSIRSIIGHPPKAHLDIQEVLSLTESELPYMDIPAYNFVNKLYKTITPKAVKHRVSQDIISNYYKFGFVRNPWSRVVSLYLRSEGIQMNDKMSFEDFVNWIEYSSDTCVHPSRKKNQLDWFTNKDNEIIVDHIGKFETITEDWNYISNQLNVDVKLPHLNKNSISNRKHYTEYYNNKTKDIINTKFLVDIEHFNYTFEK